ncbi:MAG: site-specific integrase [Pseudomonadota bacterium]
MANIRKRGPYQWEVRIRRKGYPTQSATFERKSEAEAWAREIESEMGRGVFISRAEAEKTTLTEAIDRFIEEFSDKYAQPKQVKSRAKIVQNSHLSLMPLATVRGKDVADYIKERELDGRSSQTILHEVNLISRVFEICRKDWGMESLRNPTRRANKPRQNKGRTRRLEKGEEARLLDNAGADLKPIILFALETAMRRGEIATMSWKHVDLKKKFVHLPKTKNGEARSVPLSPAALGILTGLPRNIHGDVFSLAADTITKKFRAAASSAGLNDLRFHDLRHEATSRFFERTDLDFMEIKSITGHKSMQMLARYSHLRAHKLADRLAGAKRSGG